MFRNPSKKLLFKWAYIPCSIADQDNAPKNDKDYPAETFQSFYTCLKRIQLAAILLEREI